MTCTKTTFKEPMHPWRGLEANQHEIFLPCSNLKIFYFAAGNPEHQPIIMIHGLGDEADTWRHIINPLSSEYHVVALDLPGFGRSEKPKKKYTPDLHMQSILGLMDALRVDNPILIGSSLGGMLAHGLAMRFPERVAGMILVGGAFHGVKSIRNSSLRLMQTPLLGEWIYTRFRKDPQQAYETLRSVYYDINQLPKEDRDFLFTRVNKRVWSDGQRRAYLSTLRNMVPWVRALQSNLPKRLTELSTPTLLIRGEHDPLFSEENIDYVSQRQPNAEQFTIPGSGHLPQQEKPWDFIQAVQSWLISKI